MDSTVINSQHEAAMVLFILSAAPSPIDGRHLNTSENELRN